MKYRVRVWTASGDSFRELYFGGSKSRLDIVFNAAVETVSAIKGDAVVISYEKAAGALVEKDRMVDICQIAGGSRKYLDHLPEPWIGARLKVLP